MGIHRQRRKVSFSPSDFPNAPSNRSDAFSFLLSFAESVSAYTTCPLQLVLKLAPLRSFNIFPPFHLPTSLISRKLTLLLRSRSFRFVLTAHHITEEDVLLAESELFYPTGLPVKSWEVKLEQAAWWSWECGLAGVLEGGEGIR